jgi:thiol:disulfide interchange protein
VRNNRAVVWYFLSVMKKIYSQRLVSLALLAGAVIAAYFINVEVQSYFGRQALAKAGLVNLPLPEALAKAKAENKPVLVDVSAIWCSTCRKLDNTVFADAKVKQTINDKLIFSRLEYESPAGEAFLAQHNAVGFPNLWLLNGDGQVIKKLQVTFAPQEFLAQLP